MVIPGSCDIGFLWSNMQIEVNNASYDIELTNYNFKTEAERHEESNKFEEVVEKSTSVN